MLPLMHIIPSYLLLYCFLLVLNNLDEHIIVFTHGTTSIKRFHLVLDIKQLEQTSAVCRDRLLNKKSWKDLLMAKLFLDFYLLPYKDHNAICKRHFEALFSTNVLLRKVLNWLNRVLENVALQDGQKHSDYLHNYF